VTHQPRPFPFSDHKAPWSLSLSFILPAVHPIQIVKWGPVLSNSKKKRGAVWSGEGLC